MRNPIVERWNGDIQHLLVLVGQGDGSAFACIFDQFNQRVYSSAMAILKDPQSAEDVAQRVFLKVWSSPLSFRGGSFDAWLFRVTRNAAMDELRRYPLRTRMQLEDQHQEVAAPDAIFTHLEIGMLRESLATLQAAQRALIDLNFFEGLTHGQIAERTGIPLGTVKTRIRAGLATLRTSAALAAS